MLGRRSALFLGFRYLVLLLFTMIAAFPILWLFLTSIKSDRDLFSLPPPLLFQPTWEGYRRVFDVGFFRYNLVNSFIAAVGTVAVTLILGVPAAYTLARGKSVFMRIQGILILTARMLPSIVLVIPLYLLAQRFGLSNTHLALIIAYTALNLPFAIWMIRGFVLTIPIELEQAALVDGCSLIQILRYIVLPLALPGIASSAVFIFLTCWNEFILALSLTYSQQAQTMPVAVTSFISARGIAWRELAAAACVMLLPGLLFGIFARRFLVAGLTHGTVK
ncbi:MAG TPA: carbohydrate ABC transporter permease [Chthoniobacterales bacterium]|jgi:ABC-type glycerol-3-phosphate transport system permease component|nr:carbohydrate ABC transporter permease [Chthoniobacterales bacterium]